MSKRRRRGKRSVIGRWPRSVHINLRVVAIHERGNEEE